MADTWLTPASQVWERKFGKGSFPFGPAARLLKPLMVAGNTPDTVGAHLTVYLDRTQLQYASLRRFVETFAAWAPDGGQAKEEFTVDADGVIRVG